MESKTHRTTLMQLQLRLPARMIILVIENPALDAGLVFLFSWTFVGQALLKYHCKSVLAV